MLFNDRLDGAHHFDFVAVIGRQVKGETLPAGHSLGCAGKSKTAGDRSGGTVGAKCVETRDTEHRVLQKNRRANDVAKAVGPGVLRIEIQRVVVTDRRCPALPIALVHLAGG